MKHSATSGCVVGCREERRPDAVRRFLRKSSKGMVAVLQGSQLAGEGILRSAGSGCPYCTGRKEVPENSLAVQVPSLEAEWDAEKNAPLKFADLTVSGTKRSGGGVLQGIPTALRVKSRVQGTGRPSARACCRTKTPSRQGIPHLLRMGYREERSLLPTLVAQEQ